MVRRDSTRLAVLVGEKEVRDTNGRVICYQAEHFDITDRKRKEEELSGMVLRDLNRHIENARENERTKISQNLHDDFGQKLTALKMDFSWLKARVGVQSTIVSEKFASMENSLDEAVGTVQRISSDLRPGILYDLGLTAAIEWQLNEFSKTTGIKSTFRVNLKDIAINDNLSIIVFRIIQESLTNIILHSQATEVSVNLKYQKDYLNMIIRDNGIGIDQDKLNNQKSYGLMGMKERARAYGGEVKIKGVKGTGTTVRVIIPMAVE
jgi:signal transduction histidine kinase